MRFQTIKDSKLEPVSTDEVKAHLRIDGEDLMLNLYRTAARQQAENYTGRAFLTKTIAIYNDTVPRDKITLWNTPVKKIVKFKYRDESGKVQSLQDKDYLIQGSAPEYLIPTSGQFPAGTDLRIEAVCGGVSRESVPSAIKAAILLTIGTLYENREETVKRLPTSARNLLEPYRIWQFF